MRYTQRLNKFQIRAATMCQTHCQIVSALASVIERRNLVEALYIVKHRSCSADFLRLKNLWWISHYNGNQISC